MDNHYSMPWSHRVAALWGHYAPEVLMASIVAIIALGLFPPTGPLAVTFPLAVLAFVLTTWLMLRAHDRRLCENCVASMPLNPSESAARYGRRFWLTHRGSEPRLVAGYLVVLVFTNFLPGLLGRVIWATAQSTLIYLLASYATHRRLQPWCPWCRGHGDGGEDVEAPDPVLPDSRDLHV